MTALRSSSVAAAGMGELTAVLAAAGLPTADLGEPRRLFFRYWDDGGLVGFAGLEGDGADRLLRSLVVAPDRRASGLGRMMLLRVEADARGLGVSRLHLLTISAARFFRANGYADAPRASAPQPIAASREFTALCPASAAYLLKAL